MVQAHIETCTACGTPQATPPPVLAPVNRARLGDLFCPMRSCRADRSRSDDIRNSGAAGRADQGLMEFGSRHCHALVHGSSAPPLR